jgi:hypothetical protein
MKRGQSFAVAAAIAGVGTWYFAGSGDPPPAPAVAARPAPAAAVAPLPPPAPAPASAAAEGDGLRRVPLPPVDSRTPAWISMAQAREAGDERAPPIVRTAPAEHPDASVLADHDAYAAYQQEQKQRLAAAYVQAAAAAVPKLQADLERGRAAGIPPEELARVEEKIRRIEQQRQAAGAMLSNSKGGEIQ